MNFVYLRKAPDCVHQPSLRKILKLWHSPRHYHNHTKYVWRQPECSKVAWYNWTVVLSDWWSQTRLYPVSFAIYTGFGRIMKKSFSRLNAGLNRLRTDCVILTLLMILCWSTIHNEVRIRWPEQLRVRLTKLDYIWNQSSAKLPELTVTRHPSLKRWHEYWSRGVNHRSGTWLLLSGQLHITIVTVVKSAKRGLEKEQHLCRLKEVRKNKHISLPIKVKLYESLVAATMLYSAELWPLTVKHMKTLEAANYKFQWRLLGIKWYDSQQCWSQKNNRNGKARRNI